MKLIGLTGTTGSGKGFVANEFARLGISCVDTDRIVHRLYIENQDCITALTGAFGDILASDGSIDRKKLAPIVFSDSAKLQMLNGIVHGFVRAEVEKIAAERAQNGEVYLLVDAPQLYEAGMDADCYRVIAVIAPEEIRIRRICARDSITREAAMARIAAQHSDAFFKEHADYVICNDGIQPVTAQIHRIAGELGYGKTQTN